MRSLLLPAMLVSIAACADRDAAPGNETAVVPVNKLASAPDVVVNETVGGDGSGIELSPLQPQDRAELSGELACGFATSPRSGAILIGRGNVASDERATAMIRIGDYPERLFAREPGYGAMERGTVFSGRGMTVTIERAARVAGGGEQLAYQATLLAQRADGAERRIAGLWTCGP